MLEEAMRRRDDEQTDGPEDVEDGEQDHDDSQVVMENNIYSSYIFCVIYRSSYRRIGYIFVIRLIITIFV